MSIWTQPQPWVADQLPTKCKSDVVSLHQQMRKTCERDSKNVEWESPPHCSSLFQYPRLDPGNRTVGLVIMSLKLQLPYSSLWISARYHPVACKKGKRSYGEDIIYLRIQSLLYKSFVFHGRETWCLNLREEHNWGSMRTGYIRRISGHEKERGRWKWPRTEKRNVLDLWKTHIKSSYPLETWVYAPVFRCIRRIAKIDYELRHVCPSLRPSAWNNSTPTGQIFMKFDIGGFFENLSRMLKFH
jgi:hypothetical protein